MPGCREGRKAIPTGEEGPGRSCVDRQEDVRDSRVTERRQWDTEGLDRDREKT